MELFVLNLLFNFNYYEYYIQLILLPLLHIFFYKKIKNKVSLEFYIIFCIINYALFLLFCFNIIYIHHHDFGNIFKDIFNFISIEAKSCYLFICKIKNNILSSGQRLSLQSHKEIGLKVKYFLRNKNLESNINYSMQSKLNIEDKMHEVFFADNDLSFIMQSSLFTLIGVTAICLIGLCE